MNHSASDEDVQALLPCPFCGGAEVFVIEGTGFRWRVAQCQECGAQCGEVRIQTIGKGSQTEWEATAHKEAIEEWNRRAPPAGKGE